MLLDIKRVIQVFLPNLSPVFLESILTNIKQSTQKKRDSKNTKSLFVCKKIDSQDGKIRIYDNKYKTIKNINNNLKFNI